MADKTSILFVDDEPSVLHGLRRMLYSMRDRWEMHFVTSGLDALATLDDVPVQVVITDMRMPEMDGLALLQEVRRRYPHIVRMVLSGQSENEAFCKAVGIAHQYMSKPCDAETIRTQLERAFALRALLRNDAIERFAAETQSLPTLPQNYHRLMEELNNPEPSLRTVAEIIERDVGISAKVLQLVNTAYYGLPERVSSPAAAVRIVGLETIKSMMLMVSVFAQSTDSRSTRGFSAQKLWTHSVQVGRFAQQLASRRRVPKEMLEECLTAGLLHDCGKLVLSKHFGEHYGELAIEAREMGIPLHVAEKDVLGVDHAEIGGYLLGLWGLPDSIAEAAAFHHDPAGCPGDSRSPLLFVHIGNAAIEAPGDDDERWIGSNLDMGYLGHLWLKEHQHELREIDRTVIEGTA